MDGRRSAAIVVGVVHIAGWLGDLLKFVRIVIGVLLKSADGGLLGYSVAVMVVRVDVADIEGPLDAAAIFGKELVDIVVGVVRRDAVDDLALQIIGRIIIVGFLMKRGASVCVAVDNTVDSVVGVIAVRRLGRTIVLGLKATIRVVLEGRRNTLGRLGYRGELVGSETIGGHLGSFGQS